MSENGTLLRVRAHGHPEIRATHANTLELTSAAEITMRATCVIGVAAEVIQRPVLPLVGPVRIRIRVDDTEIVVHAVGNPYWSAGHDLVVRRSGNRLPDTAATHGDATAADLPRELVARLRDPATQVELSVSASAARPDGRSQVVLLWAPADADGQAVRTRAELAAAQLIVAEDAPARELAVATGQRPVDGTDRDALADALADGRRVVVLATRDVPGAALATLPEAVRHETDPEYEAVGLPPALAVAAVSPSRGPLYVVDRAKPRSLAAQVTALPGGARMVVARVPVTEAARTLRTAGAEWGVMTGAVLCHAQSPRERLCWGRIGELSRDLIDEQHGEVYYCLDTPGGPSGETDRQLLGLMSGLLTHGVSARTVALALGTVPGWSRSRAYDLVTSLTTGSAGER